MKQNTIRNTLLGTYAVIILIAFFVMALLYIAIQVPTLQEQAFSTLQQHTVSVGASVDDEIDQMRTIALNIAYSTMVQDRFFHQAGTDPDSYSDSNDAQVLSTILATLIFPNRPVDQINLYSKDGTMVASGLNNVIIKREVQGLDWYEDIITDDNHQVIFYSGIDLDISKYSTDVYSKQFISLVMENYDNFNNVCGYIEVKQRLTRVISAGINYNNSYGEQLYFYDKEGSLLFSSSEEFPSELFSMAKEQGFPEEFISFTLEGARQYLICVPCDGGNFYTIMAVQEKTLMQPVYNYIQNILLITVIAFVGAFAMSYFASRRITRPIDEICRQIGDIDIEKPASLPALETDILELKTLHSSFDQMQSTLSEHVSKLLLLQNQEMQSRMLALQSQMNPHFLFNSLASIQAMADENMNEEIGVMCQSMANILRYISSDSSQEVPLEEEIRYTKDFLICMSIRYQGDLTYEINIPESMNGVMVPKLCVQLLVENAIKFTTTKRPPYHVEITGIVDEDHYELRIRDNGPGFARETLDTLYERMEEIKKTSMLPSLKINGMGILNVYIRYCLLHENQFIFRLENNPEGGACVVIGEYYHESEV